MLTREVVRPHLANVTVTPITSAIRCLSTEVDVDARNGLDRTCVVWCDNITTIPKSALCEQIGYLIDSQEAKLTEAISHAFDMD